MKIQKLKGASMRIDKYLQLSRLIKRRALAKKACEADKILLDGMPVKPSKDVEEGQIITIIYPEKTMDVKILDVPTTKNVSKKRARELYEDLANAS
jgi:ribosomal 50S subunit-recycling heat shock protein